VPIPPFAGGTLGLVVHAATLVNLFTGVGSGNLSVTPPSAPTGAAGKMQMKQKLIIGLVLIPGLIVVFTASLLLAINEYYANDNATAALVAANATAEDERAAVTDRFDETFALYEDGDPAYETNLPPSEQQAFDAVVNGDLDSFPSVVFTEEAGFDPAGYDPEEVGDVETALALLVDDIMETNEIVEVKWIDSNNWVITTVIVTLFSLAMLLLVVAMLWRRDDDLPLTWAESIVYTTVAFFFLILMFGFVPHFILKVWDSVVAEGKWTWFPYVADAGGNTGTFVVWGTRVIAEGLDYVMIWQEDVERVGMEWSWYVIRDFLVTAWYGLTVVFAIAGAYWAQKLYQQDAAKKAPAAEALTSPYGRPMLTGSK